MAGKDEKKIVSGKLKQIRMLLKDKIDGAK